MPIRVRNDETSVATDDASSNAAGLKKNGPELLSIAVVERWAQKPALPYIPQTIK